MYVFYALAVIVIWLGVKSLLSGLRFSAYVRRECGSVPPHFTPYVSIIAPCRGYDIGLKDNLAALFAQDYPHYEIIFVTGESADASVPVIEEARQNFTASEIPMKLLYAGKATDSGQKVHNLRHAVTQIDPRTEALVFVDADARPGPAWLRSLVAPLCDESMGATTGYRWFLSSKGGLASHLLSVWNASIASALGEHSEKNFCWGGSTAIRRSTFDGLRIRERWQGTVSDDFTVMRVLREANLPIKFVPDCLTPSLEDYDFRQLFEFTTRQLQITRVYAPHFWRATLIGGLLFNGVFFGGIVLLAVRPMLGLSFVFPSLALLIIFILGSTKSYIRWRAVLLPLTHYRKEMRKGLASHVLLWPLGSLLFLYNAFVAAFSRRIVWRGIGYELKSPTEAVIISRSR